MPDAENNILELERYSSGFARLRPARNRGRLLLCISIALALLAWAVAFPYTGDGDAILHYWSARDALIWPKGFCSAWARWGALFPIVLPAQFGMLPARGAMIAVAVVCCAQTMAMADDLDMPRGALAGLFVILQPLAFASAGDTMTEIPMALWMVVAIRLWWGRHRAAACAIVSFLPAVRPEGFFIIPLSAILVLSTTDVPLSRRCGRVLWLGLGMIAWLALGKMFGGEWLYFRSSWNWPAGGYPAYGRGSLLHHIIRWPVYCGPVLTILFLEGFLPCWPKRRDWPRPSMALPLAIWWLFIIAHSILFWRGWFASVGLMRIFVATSPFTALICLRGFNRLESRLRRRMSRPALNTLAAGALTIALATPIAYYFDDPTHFRYRPIAVASQWMCDRYLVQTAPALFFGDPIAADWLPIGSMRKCVVANSSDASAQRAMLAHLPVGAVGIWDNQHAQQWFNLSIEDIQKLGYRMLFETDQTVSSHVLYRRAFGNGLQRYVVLEKVN